METTTKQPVRSYLSLPAGALMGVVQLEILARLEKDLERPVYDVFAGGIGCSVGAINLCALFVPNNEGKVKKFCTKA